MVTILYGSRFKWMLIETERVTMKHGTVAGKENNYEKYGN